MGVPAVPADGVRARLLVARSEHPHERTPHVVDPERDHVRPHELDIERTPIGTTSMAARVVQINPSGAVVKVRVVSQDGSEWTVDVIRENAHRLKLQTGDIVYVAPKSVRVFMPMDYAI